MKQLELKTKTLKKLCNIQNMDRTINRGGKIEQAVTLRPNHAGKDIHHQFFIVDIGPDDFIFRYPFLEAASLSID